MSLNKFLPFVPLCELVTGEEQTLTELKSSSSVILTADLSAVILNPKIVSVMTLSLANHKNTN